MQRKAEVARRQSGRMVGKICHGIKTKVWAGGVEEFHGNELLFLDYMQCEVLF